MTMLGYAKPPPNLHNVSFQKLQISTWMRFRSKQSLI
jgi:hypothetical protein